MTKTVFVNTELKPSSEYTAVKLTDTEEQSNKVDHSGTTCWYVLGVLSTIFCCLPCGLIGLVHAMVAKHEGERGNSAGHRRRLYQAKCWTCWSIALGLTVLLLTGLYLCFAFGLFSRFQAWCGTDSLDYSERYRHWNGTDYVYGHQWNSTYPEPRMVA